MNIKQHDRMIPGFTVRRSVALISAAILFSAPAQAEIEIGRLPSTVTGEGVIGAKPNVFLVIDNSEKMSGSSKKSRFDPDGNYLQQTAGALIASLPQLEGKVRLGYSTGRAGIFYLDGRTGTACRNFKLNGNVNRLEQFIPGLKTDLAKNKNYLLANDDYVFGAYGSGYGEITPRDFSGNYARYIYAWLGGMCIGSSSENDGLKNASKFDAGIQFSPTSQPPYADIRDGQAAYRAAAAAAKNTNSYPLRNFNPNFGGSYANPIIDMHARILALISDKDFLSQVGNCRAVRNGECTSFGSELIGTSEVAVDPKRLYPYGAINASGAKYDTYASADPSTGFPQENPPLSCRKNYEIIITKASYSKPHNLAPNGYIGVYGIHPKNDGTYSWSLPAASSNVQSQGITEGTFPEKEDYTMMYRFHAAVGTSEIQPLGIWPQDPDRKYLFSKTALQGYYMDLRGDLVNDVPAYYEVKQARQQGFQGSKIPLAWDRKNDTANWQHLSIFSLGFRDGFHAWVQAEDYLENYPGTSGLEGYLRAIEGGEIYAYNKPLADWGRGGYGLKSRDYYIFRGKGGAEKNITFSKGEGALGQMDFAKAGVISRGGAYIISDYSSIKKVVANIANRIEKAMASGITGAALGGSGRVTASAEASGSVSTLLTTYLNEETLSGNIFAFKNCPLIAPTIIDENGRSVPNPEWKKNECGSRLWNAATALNNGVSSIGQKTITNIIASDNADDQSAEKSQGAIFSWENVAKDKELKAQLSGGNDELGQARVDWVNGTLRSELPAAVRGQFRKRANIEIPVEGQRYKKNENGDLVKDDQGDYVKADPINIPNRIGEIVYAVPKSVDNVGTLSPTHPLYNDDYANFIVNTVKKRQPLVLAGANDGHLYAFTNPANRSYSELAFSYIPRAVIADGRLTTMTQSSTSADSDPPSLVNGPFTVRDAQVDGKWGTYVVGTLGAGGNTVYALDISNGRANPSMFKWEVDLGQGEIMSEPRIVWLRKPCSIGTAECKVDGKWVVLLASGYNAKDVSLVVLDLKDGSELARIRTGAQYTAKADTKSDGDVRTCKLKALPDNASSALQAVHSKLDKEVKVPANVTCDNGLGALTVFDADNDSGADFVFAGDLLGDVWKFDLTGFFNANGSESTDLNKALKVAYNSPLFIATTSSSDKVMPDTRQPITTMIELDDGAYGEGSMLYFGTGRLFNQFERGIPQPQSLYGIWDIPRYTEQGVASFKLPLRRNGGSNYDLLHYRFVTIDSKNVIDPNSSLKKFQELRTMERIDDLSSTDYLTFDLAGRNVNPDAKAVGWVADFPEIDKGQGSERVLERARTFDGAVYFATFTPDKGETPAESCTTEKGGAGGKGRFYMMDRITGGPLTISPFDFNGDGGQDSRDGIKVGKGTLGKGADNYTVDKDNNVNVSVSGLMTGNGSSSILSIEGVKKRAEMAKMANCDYTRQIVFPATVDPNTGNPLVLTSCNINRYRVWKQPVID